jgi:hypothetical protein
VSARSEALTSLRGDFCTSPLTAFQSFTLRPAPTPRPTSRAVARSTARFCHAFKALLTAAAPETTVLAPEPAPPTPEPQAAPSASPCPVPSQPGEVVAPDPPVRLPFPYNVMKLADVPPEVWERARAAAKGRNERRQSDEQLTCHQASRLGSNGMGNLLGHQRKEDSMSRARKQKTQPYLPTILERLDQAQGELKPGSLYTIDVLHDDWCSLLNETGACNCNPEIRHPQRMAGTEAAPDVGHDVDQCGNS